MIIKSDCAVKKIYNKHIVYLFLVCILRGIYVTLPYKEIGIALLINCGLFLVMYLVRQNSIGAGDVKLAIVFSLWCYYPYCILAIYISFFLGLIVAIFNVICLHKKYTEKIPFGPMLILGNIIAYNFYEQIINFGNKVVFRCGM